RAIPNLWVFRPGDANEVVESWRAIMPLERNPVAVILTRQNLPTLDRTKYAPAAGARRGAYVLADAPGGKPAVLLMATGSELAATVAAYERLKEAGVAARVVSMPCWELFESQDAAYRESVLPSSVTARVAVEAAAEFGWSKYLGPRGRFVGMHGFGASAPADTLMKHFGITPENIVEQAKAALG
ncbi:MAG: transketolase, partial [Planctomycetes bacterium]|nr:transketolase [Planctomycetota bacterium]